MTLQEIKEKIIDTIEKNRNEIIAVGEHVLKNPEIGDSEEKTSALVRRTLEELDIPYEYPLALTGVKGRLSGKTGGRNVCIIGEMDALKCTGHPYADIGNIAHACGHHAQMAAMLGAAIGLAKSGVMENLFGSVIFLAAPAEEFIDLDYRRMLKEEKKISYFGGKQELIAEGAFDDVDMASGRYRGACTAG